MIRPLFALFFLVSGCGALEDCKDGCEDNYAACVDAGSSAVACKAERVQCEEQCEDAELQRDQHSGDVESR
jgi:hypothetical protein